MAKNQINERQMDVLRWIVEGCPEGAWCDFTYKTSAQALQNRGLVKIARRRGVWSAEATPAGHHYLEHGTYPAPQTQKECAVRHPNAKAPSATPTTLGAVPLSHSSPDEPLAPEAIASAAPKPPAAQKPRKKTLGEQLIEDVLASGGSLVFKQEYGSGGPNWSARIRSAQRCGKLPDGKELVHRWRAGGYEIAIQDIPEWKLAVLDPIPVPQRLHKPHAIVAALRDGKPALGLSKPVQQRALRLAQAIAAEAEHRGHKVQLASSGHGGQRSRRSGGVDLFTVTAQGQQCGVAFGQEQDRAEHVPTAKELADAERYSWVRIPAHDYTPSGRLTITLNGGITHRQSLWRDTASRSLEDQLPEILQEVDLRGRAAERKRIEEEERARATRRRWEAAMQQARTDYADAFRVRVLQEQEQAWRQAARLSEYLAAMRERIEATPEGAERTEAEAWLTWATRHVQSLDPLTRPLHMPEVPEPGHGGLKPFLHGWSPYGPYSG